MTLRWSFAAILGLVPVEPALGPLRAVWLFSIMAALLLLAIFLRYVVSRFGINPQTLYKARSTIGFEGAPTVGFYFFYFAELVVPSSAVLALETGRRRYWAVAGMATLSLLATTGRTNATKAVIWTVFLVFWMVRNPAA